MLLIHQAGISCGDDSTSNSSSLRDLTPSASSASSDSCESLASSSCTNSSISSPSPPFMALGPVFTGLDWIKGRESQKKCSMIWSYTWWPGVINYYHALSLSNCSNYYESMCVFSLSLFLLLFLFHMFPSFLKKQLRIMHRFAGSSNWPWSNTNLKRVQTHIETYFTPNCLLNFFSTFGDFPNQPVFHTQLFTQLFFNFWGFPKSTFFQL